MQYKNLVTNFVRSWNFTRSETIEILNSLTNEELQFKPNGKNWQPFFWQFACIGRTQIVYTEAINTGKMNFSLFGSKELPSKTAFQTKNELSQFLEKTNTNWRESIRVRRHEEDFTVAWPGFKKPLVNHIMCLAEHERLHHGQFISYFTLMEKHLPSHFKQNWAL